MICQFDGEKKLKQKMQTNIGLINFELGFGKFIS
jgi:hypothetical protein